MFRLADVKGMNLRSGWTGPPSNAPTTPYLGPRSTLSERAHRPGDEPKARSLGSLRKRSRRGSRSLIFSPLSSSSLRVCDGAAKKTFPSERMEVSAGLRQPPAAAASLRGGRSVAPPPRAVSHFARSASRAVKLRASSIYDLQKSKSNLESLFCYDKSIPEENIGKPTGLNLEKKNVGNNSPCSSCEAKGVVLCATCAGSGLYVDSILESQGIIVKVRCLGCGGTGNIMCSKCGGRGHT